jgi:hypothetical protein
MRGVWGKGGWGTGLAGRGREGGLGGRGAGEDDGNDERVELGEVRGEGGGR